MADNMFKTLGSYVTEVFDTNKDGVINFKDLLGLFPNHAVAIAFLVVDLLVLVAEYRVWDVGMTITSGDPYKALGFVLVSALPFYLAQILWLYPRARGIQRSIALLMGAGGLYTSAQFGLADLSRKYDVTQIVNMVVYLGVGYIVLLLVYIVVDESVKAGRMKAQAHAKAQQQREINSITRSVLNDLRESLKEEEALKREFTPEAVEAHLDRLRGGKGKSNNSSRSTPNDSQKPQDERTERIPTQFTTDEVLAKMGMTLDQAKLKYGGLRYQDFSGDCSQAFGNTHIDGPNMKKVFYGDINPTQAERNNSRVP
jgi:hypothetical protein